MGLHYVATLLNSMGRGELGLSHFYGHAPRGIDVMLVHNVDIKPGYTAGHGWGFRKVPQTLNLFTMTQHVHTHNNTESQLMIMCVSVLPNHIMLFSATSAFSKIDASKTCFIS